MDATACESCIAFLGTEQVASGDPADVAVAVRAEVARDAGANVLVFDSVTSRPIEFDLRGSAEDVAERVRTARVTPEPSEEAPRSPGRPKLGVVGREVTLLPRHWDWLNAQPGGASVTLRKLVEAARKNGAGAERVRAAQDATFRFAQAMAGDAFGFEEAVRALYAGDAERFSEHTESWPTDVRAHARALAASAFAE